MASCDMKPLKLASSDAINSGPKFAGVLTSEEFHNTATMVVCGDVNLLAKNIGFRLLKLPNRLLIVISGLAVILLATILF
jgi:hypothetical protein